MKRILGVLLSVLVPLSVLSVLAEDAQQAQPPAAYLAGLVSEVQDDGSILLKQFDGEEVLVHLSEETVITIDGPLAVGRAVLITSSGAMTHSLPPQITAMAISSDTIEGTVQSVDAENNRLLVLSAEYQEVLVTLKETELAVAYADQYVQILFGGFLTLSLPPQAHAIGIRPVAAERGVILERSSDSLLLAANGDALRVSLTDATKMPDDLASGETVLVMFSIPAADPQPQNIEAIVVARAEEA